MYVLETFPKPGSSFCQIDSYLKRAKGLAGGEKNQAAGIDARVACEDGLEARAHVLEIGRFLPAAI